MLEAVGRALHLSGTGPGYVLSLGGYATVSPGRSEAVTAPAHVQRLLDAPGPNPSVALFPDGLDQQELAQQLLAQTKEQRIDLVGQDGLLNRLTKNVLKTNLNAASFRLRPQRTDSSWPLAEMCRVVSLEAS